MTEAVTAAQCVNCGAALAGPYCAACGQRARTGRLSFGHVARQVAGELSPVDHGIVYTTLAVLTRPGRMAREYVDGRTVRYVGPVKYFMLLVGAAQILALRIGVVRDLVAGVLSGYYERRPVHGELQARLLAFVTSYFVSLSAVMVPLFALAARSLFRRARLNYAEHLVLALYTGAQQIAMFVLVAWFITVVRVPGIDGVWLAGALVYEGWALRQFTGLSRAQVAWRTLAASLLAILLGTVVFGGVMAVIEHRA